MVYGWPLIQFILIGKIFVFCIPIFFPFVVYPHGVIRLCLFLFLLQTLPKEHKETKSFFCKKMLSIVFPRFLKLETIKIDCFFLSIYSINQFTPGPLLVRENGRLRTPHYWRNFKIKITYILRY